jgi:large subunit ribosomal protein L2
MAKKVKTKGNVVRKRNPVTAGSRHTVLLNYRELLTRTTPEKKLLFAKTKVTGRKAGGHVTVRHRGGGVKRIYRSLS